MCHSGEGVNFVEDSTVQVCPELVGKELHAILPYSNDPFRALHKLLMKLMYERCNGT